MTTYKEIVGQKIRKISSNPSEAQTGQMWYNTTVSGLKALQISEAWSSTAPLSVVRDKPGAAGTQTASLAIGGETALTSVDEYNGTGWQSAPAINTGRHGMASGGTTSAAWKAGGSPPETTTATEEYDGSSWTTVPGTLNTGRYILGSCGTQTAALCNGGYNTANVNNSEEYDGSSWSNGNAMNTARRTCADIGIQTAAVSFGGQPPAGPAQDDVEEYDGTSWTTVGNYPTNISDSAGSGTLTAGLAFGGNVPPSTTATKNYDGTTWTASPASLGTAAKRHGGTPSGTNAAAIAFGGDGPGSHVTTSQEYNKSTNTITAAAWTSSSNMNSGRTGSAGFANKDDLVIAGGFISTPSPADDDSKALVEEYNGTSWSEVTNMPTKRTSASGCGASQTSGMVSGGIHTNQTTSVEYDGTNWTSGGAIPAVSRMAAHCGTVPAALRCGGAGNPGPALDQTIEYDGSSWTTANTMPHAEYGHMLVGTQTAAVFSGGHNAPTRDNLYEYDGTNWTTSPATLAVSINNNAGAAANGTQTAAMWMGGAPAVTASQVYDGTSVVTQPSLGAGRYSVNCGGGGTSTAAILGGGSGDTDATEEFTGETTAVNIADFTTS